jgi:glutamate 5-kinase
MIAKLRAMRLASCFGITMVIANGNKENIIVKIIAGENEGTIFLPNPKASLKQRDRWIVSTKISTGSIKIDTGAVAALKNGKSLLAVGVKKIYGTFDKGEVIDVLDMEGDALAIGMVKMSYVELQELSSNKEKIYNQEVIHADDLIII